MKLGSLSIAFCLFFPIQATQVLIGDRKHQDRSFDFKIKHHAFYVPEGRLFIASDRIDSKDSIAMIDRNRKFFLGITPERVTLNKYLDQKNPLYGKSISHISLLSLQPIVCAHNDPSIYVLNYFMHEGNDHDPVEIIQSQKFANALGKTDGNILAMTTNACYLSEPLDSSKEIPTIFVALSNSKGTFDGNGSGIAFAHFRNRVINNKTEYFFDIINSQNGESEYRQAESKKIIKRRNEKRKPQSQENKNSELILSLQGNRAFPIDLTTPALKIGNAVSSLGTIIDLYYDRDLERLYIALDVYAGTNTHDGARSITVGQIVNNKLTFMPIAPDNVFTNLNEIVGIRGANAHTAISKVRTMVTSTHLRYLVVVNAAGQPSVHALPLVDDKKSQAHGTLADVHSKPKNYNYPEYPYSFVARAKTKPATTSSQVYSIESPEARIGGSVELTGTITDMNVIADSVFIALQNDQTMQDGIFHSQALFNNYGEIVRWTNWKRVGGVNDSCNGFGYDPYQANFIYVTNSSIKKTSFKQGENEREQFLAQEFPKENAGIHTLIDFNVSTPGFTSQQGSKLSCILVTGYKKIALLQTASDNNKYGPVAFKLEQTYKSSQGSFNCFSPSQNIVMEGGALDEIEHITSGAIAYDGHQGWLLVGGTKGIAILASKKGDGWSTLGDKFEGLRHDLAFKKILDASQVQKIICENEKVYVLMSDRLIRFSLTSHAIKTNRFNIVTLAQAQQGRFKHINSFSDMLVAGPLILLATSNGLLQPETGIDIRSVTQEAMQWRAITLPESTSSKADESPITRLFAITATGFEKDLGQDGTVYALNACVGTLESQIYRLYINSKHNVVTNDTVTLYPDMFVENLRTFFVDFADYRNYVITDGASIFCSRSSYGKDKSLIEMLSPNFKSGQPFKTQSRIKLSFLNDKEKSYTIGQMVYCSGLGCWMIPGDFGVRIQG